MPSFKLIPFPNQLCSSSPGIAISGSICKNNNGLNCIFRVKGDITSIKWPPLIENGGRGDELWKHTCFEMFVGKKHHNQYQEYNFSPSTQWAIYGFKSYRTPIPTAALPTPVISLPPSSESLFLLEANIPLHEQLENTPLQIGIATVIETVKGSLHYYALTHCGQKPDFHLRDSFIIYLD